MTDELLKTLPKLAIPTAGIIAALVVARLRGLPLQETFGLRLPRVKSAAIWIGAWIAWVALSELITRALQLEPPKHWEQKEPLVILLRILAIGILGPICEELIVRGVAFSRLSATRLGPYGAIALTSVVWAVMHLQYGLSTLIVIFLDGIFLGLARYQSRSIAVPIVMHIMGNLYSISQSL